jgi:hypothetical protein
MDCEGGENDSIPSASEDTLRNFSHIMVEYHYWYKNLKRKLEKRKVSVTRLYAVGAKSARKIYLCKTNLILIHQKSIRFTRR